MKSITFDETSRNVILQLFGKGIDAEGYIVDLSDSKRVVSPHGEEVLAKDFAGIKKGSEIFLTKDLPSLLEQVSDIEA